MTDPVFSSILQRDLDDARQAIRELLARVADMDEDGPADDVTAYVVSPAAKAAASGALAAGPRPRTLPDRSVGSLEDLVRQMFEDSARLEHRARDMSHPDYQNAHQGHALGLRRGAYRLSDFLEHRATAHLELVAGHR